VFSPAENNDSLYDFAHFGSGIPKTALRVPLMRVNHGFDFAGVNILPPVTIMSFNRSRM